ncbi:MAG: lamin tail domain-containing protein [Candidatus Methanomethylophilaceae archaeon]|nr:lamin tail domain-containing protein [Candidatus Methanomethylophilaceae archaeon]
MKSRSGAMPFAVIAVMILVASVACGALAADYERASEEARNVEMDARTLDDALEGIRTHVNRGLAEVIRDVSVNGAGSIDERMAEFDEKAKDWLEYQFPIADNGACAELVSYDLELGVQPLRAASGEGCVPAYLKATGDVNVRLSTGFGHAESSIEVSTDSSCTLPLALEQGSLFERMASEGSVSLSEMMAYQLTNLAQVRVLNGYGALDAYGRAGTDKILTKQDVLDAYGSSMEILKAICFRDGGMALEQLVDPAEALISDGGSVRLDLQAAYAQAMSSLADDLAIKWYDYLYGDAFLDALQSSRKALRDAQMAILSFVKGESPFDASPYLKAVMEINGIGEDGYRFPGSGSTVLEVDGKRVEFENPARDVLETEWIKSFRTSFESERSWLKEQLRTVLRASALQLAEDKGLGQVVVEADPHDERRFADSLLEAVSAALDAFDDGIREALPSAVLDAGVSDPLCGAVCAALFEDRGSYVLEAEFESRARSALAEAFSPEEAESMMSGEAYRAALEAYRSKVYDDMKVFESPAEMPEWRGGFVEWAIVKACAVGMGSLKVPDLVGKRLRLMCEEMLSACDMNACGEVASLPGMGAFDVERAEGGVSYERLEASIATSPQVSGPRIAQERCVHSVGFEDGSMAGYVTVLSVSLSDDVRYEISGTGTMSSSMGSRSCLVSGDFPVSVSFDVVVSSGWALAGVEYGPSCTVLTDLWENALPLLEPVLEPLKKVMEVLKKVMAAVGDKVSEAARYVSAYIEELYEDVIVPLEAIAKWAESCLEPVFRELAESFGISIGFGKQSVSMSLLGYDLKITTDAVSLMGKTKTLFTLELSTVKEGRTVTAGVTLKTTGGIEADDVRFFGFGSIVDPGEDGRTPWKVKVRLDPFMKNGKHLLTVDGRAGKVAVNISLPELVEYHEMGLRLSDVPGVGEALSNIPLPILGAKAEVDAGFSLKYSAPIKFGLLINELESNPSGEDRGNEWIELYNNTESTIDLDGYTLTASSDWKTKVMALSGSIAPGEAMDVEPTFLLVNSSGKYTRSGEAITLKDPDGAVVDKTPTLRDGDNDEKTWHREFDGSTEWVLSKGTRGSSNGGRMQAAISAGDLKDIAWEAVQEAFGDIGEITDTESLGRFTERLVFHTVDGVIDKVCGCVVEASVYVSVDVADLTSTAKGGFRVALRTDSQLAEDCLKFVAGKLEEMLLGMDNPYSISLGKAFMEDVDLEVGIHARVGMPDLLKIGMDLPEANLEAVFRTNLASISGIFGDEAGRPEATFGLVIRGCPLGGIPDGIRADSKMDHDLWLIKATVKW